MHTLLLTLTTLLPTADNDAAKAELDKLAGTWVMVSGQHDGNKLADEQVKRSKITWKGKNVEVETPHQSKETIKATVMLHPKKNPAEMEWTRTSGPGAGKKMHAIYEFLGYDRYRICFALPGKKRPIGFSTKKGSGHFLHVWKRMKE